MAAADVLLCRSMGWVPGTKLFCTESLRGRPPFQVVVEITRIELDTVYAKLLVEDGHTVTLDFDEPACLTTSEWRVYSDEDMRRLQNMARGE